MSIKKRIERLELKVKKSVKWDSAKDKTHFEFYKNLKKLIRKLWDINKKYRENSDNYKEIKDETKKFLNKHLPILKENKGALGNYMATFANTVENFTTVGEDELIRITPESIEIGLNENSRYSFLILLSCDLTFKETWLFIEKVDDREALANILDRMYHYANKYVLDNKIDKSKYPIPRIEYKTAIHGRMNTLKLLANDAIRESKDFKEKDKAKVRKNTNSILDGMADCFEKNKVDGDLDFNNIGIMSFDQNILNAMNDIKLFFENNKNKYSRKDITDLCMTFIDLYEKYPTEAKENKELKDIMNIFIRTVDTQAMGSYPSEIQMVIKKLKKIYYDPSFKLDTNTSVFMKELEKSGVDMEQLKNLPLNRKAKRLLMKKYGKKKN